jgi:hypothetical protein
MYVADVSLLRMQRHAYVFERLRCEPVGCNFVADATCGAVVERRPGRCVAQGFTLRQLLRLRGVLPQDRVTFTMEQLDLLYHARAQAAAEGRTKLKTE